MSVSFICMAFKGGFDVKVFGFPASSGHRGVVKAKGGESVVSGASNEIGFVCIRGVQNGTFRRLVTCHLSLAPLVGHWT